MYVIVATHDSKRQKIWKSKKLYI